MHPSLATTTTSSSSGNSSKTSMKRQRQSHRAEDPQRPAAAALEVVRPAPAPAPALASLPPAAATAVCSFLELPSRLALVTTASSMAAYLGSSSLALRRPAGGLTMESFNLVPSFQRHEGTIEHVVVRDGLFLTLCCAVWRRGLGVASLRSLTLAPTDHNAMAPSALQLMAVTMRSHLRSRGPGCFPLLERVVLQNVVLKDSKADRGIVLGQTLLAVVLPHVAPSLQHLEIRQSHLSALALSSILPGLWLRGLTMGMQTQQGTGLMGPQGNGSVDRQEEKAPVVLVPPAKMIKLMGGGLPSVPLVVAPPPYQPRPLVYGDGTEESSSTLEEGEEEDSSAVFASGYSHSFSSSCAPSLGTPSPPSARAAESAGGSGGSTNNNKSKPTAVHTDAKKATPTPAAGVAATKRGHAALPLQPSPLPAPLLPPVMAPSMFPPPVKPLAALVIASSSIHADGRWAVTQLQKMAAPTAGPSSLRPLQSVSVAVSIVEPEQEE